jgi:hypothetical protein
MSQTIKGHIEVPVDYLKNKIMKKLNWGDLFQVLFYGGIFCVGVGILSWTFIFMWQIIKSVF